MNVPKQFLYFRLIIYLDVVAYISQTQCSALEAPKQTYQVSPEAQAPKVPKQYGNIDL